MLTEFEVRRELDLIQSSDAPPRAKARRLLRLGKSLRKQACILGDARARSRRSSNINAQRQLERMEANSRRLQDEVRSTALTLLRLNAGYRWHKSLA